jgi:hypothetical protein
MISQTAPYVCRSKEGAIMCYRSIGCTGGFDGWQMHLDRHGGLATVLLSWLCCSGHLGLLVIYVQCTCMQIWIGRSRNSARDSAPGCWPGACPASCSSLCTGGLVGTNQGGHVPIYMLEPCRNPRAFTVHIYRSTVNSTEQGYKEIWKIVHASLGLQCMQVLESKVYILAACSDGSNKYYSKYVRILSEKNMRV